MAVKPTGNEMSTRRIHSLALLFIAALAAPLEAQTPTEAHRTA